jgi:surface antigen
MTKLGEISMKKRVISLVALLPFFSLPLVYAETLDEATLRSGSVLAEHNIPPVLNEGELYRFTWMTQSYVPINSWLKLVLPDGSSQILESTLDRDEQGTYSIGGQFSRNYYFHVDYTIPDDTVGKTTLGFYHSQDDGESPLKMYGLLPTGVVDRPAGTSGKVFYRNICSQNSYGGQCVAYVRDYFGGSYIEMPGLCVNSDCGAYHAYDDWDFGFGKGVIPKMNSIMVIDNGGELTVGHVAVVVAVEDNEDGTWNLITQESNWDLDERIDCGTTYTFNAETLQVSRGGSWYDLRGFIYSNNN